MTNDLRERLQAELDEQPGRIPILISSVLIEEAIAALTPVEDEYLAGLVKALSHQKQCDPDGVMCEVSRQAVCEAMTTIQRLAREMTELEGRIAELERMSAKAVSDFDAMLDELAREKRELEIDRDSWRRVCERLESEKRAAERQKRELEDANKDYSQYAASQKKPDRIHALGEDQ